LTLIEFDSVFLKFEERGLPPNKHITSNRDEELVYVADWSRTFTAAVL
jgi:hypothetical protein